eukprot:Rhum_TRINITY_DN146_c0_g1::Rhum_TRINITY_DN146_c0_g1_i1::g.441::m.441
MSAIGANGYLGVGRLIRNKRGAPRDLALRPTERWEAQKLMDTREGQDETLEKVIRHAEDFEDSVNAVTDTPVYFGRYRGGEKTFKVSVGITRITDPRIEAERLIVQPPSSVMPPKRLLGYRGRTEASEMRVSSYYYVVVTRRPFTAGGLNIELSALFKDVADRGQAKRYAWMAARQELERSCGLLASYSQDVRPTACVECDNADVIVNEVHSLGSVHVAGGGRGGGCDDGGGDAAAAASFFELVVAKVGVTHGDMLASLAGRLRAAAAAAHGEEFAREAVSERGEGLFGCHDVGECAGHTTQPVYVRAAAVEWLFADAAADTDAARAAALEAALSSGDAARGSPAVRVSSAAPARMLPGADTASALWTTLRSVDDTAGALAGSLDGLRRRKRFANFFPPSDFDAPRCRGIPLWCVGWHLYRGDDLQAAYALLAREIYIHYPKFAAVLIVPFAHWPEDELCRSLRAAVKRDGAPRGALCTLLEHVFDDLPNDPHVLAAAKMRARHKPGRPVPDAVQQGNRTPHFDVIGRLLENNAAWCGEALASFNKLLWNMLASARLEESKGVISHDLLADEYGLRHAAVVRDTMYTRAEAAPGAAGQAKFEEDEGTIDQVVLPLAGLFLPADHAEDLEVPHNRYDRKMGERLLQAFGVTPNDMLRLFRYLPEEFAAVSHRRIIERVRKVAFETRPTLVPAMRTDWELTTEQRALSKVPSLEMRIQLEENKPYAPVVERMRWGVNGRVEEKPTEATPCPKGTCEGTAMLVTPGGAAPYCALREAVDVMLYESAAKGRAVRALVKSERKKKTAGAKEPPQRSTSRPRSDGGRVRSQYVPRANRA